MELENIQGKIYIQEFEMRKTLNNLICRLKEITRHEKKNTTWWERGLRDKFPDDRFMMYDKERIYGTRNTKTEEIEEIEEEILIYSMRNYNGWWR